MPSCAGFLEPKKSRLGLVHLLPSSTDVVLEPEVSQKRNSLGLEKRKSWSFSYYITV